MEGLTYIAGFGQTSFSQHNNFTVVDLVLEAVEKALDNAKISHKEVDYAVTSSVDLFDGKTASNVLITEVVGAVLKGETRIASDSLMAAIHADQVIRTKRYKTVLVTAHCKGSEIPRWPLTQWGFDPIYLQPLGLDYRAMELLQNNIREDKDNDRKQLANPDLDGAVAVIFSSDENLIKKRRKISLLSSAYLSDVHYPGRRDLNSGILRPTVERLISRASLDDLSSIKCAGLSAGNRGQLNHYQRTIEDFKFNGNFLPNRETPFIVEGLSRLVDVAQFLEIETDHNVKALVHGHAGPAAQNETLLLMEAQHAP